MKLTKAIELLEEWVRVDRELMKENPDTDKSDYDKFCEEKNQAIETVLRKIKEEK